MGIPLSFEYENELIEFDLFFSKRKTIGIEIKFTGKIKVTAPIGTSKSRILSVVNEKSAWILRKKTELASRSENHVSDSTYKEGASLVYLGKNYIINVIENSKCVLPQVEIQDDKLNIYATSTHEQVIELAVLKWLNQMTQKHVEDRVSYFQKYFEVSPSKIIIKPQKSRWGSCNSRGELRFNKACIKLSERALDYLVVHEMSHLVHMNHSKDFWNVVQKIIPDYKSARAELKRTWI